MSVASLFQQPSICEDGSAVTVYFPPSLQSDDDPQNLSSHSKCLQSAFHAAWLWSNAPSNIMIPSGQRVRTPGSFPNLTIRSAVLGRSDIAQSPSSHDNTSDKYRSTNIPAGTNSMVTSLPPPYRSVHPIHTTATVGTTRNRDATIQTYHDNDDTVENSGGRWVLIITFFHHDQHPNESNDVSSVVANPNFYNDDDEVCYYDLQWLRQWTYDDRSLFKRRLAREVTPIHTFCNKPTTTGDDGDNDGDRLKRHKGLIHVNFSSIVTKSDNYDTNADEEDCTNDGNDSDAIFQLLDAVFVEGAAIVTNAPAICDGPLTPVSVIGKAVAGSLSHGSLYGSIFHVKSIPNAINVAYTSHHLGPHQDLPYYESKPGLQLLHCFSMDPERIEGGESFLVDAMAAAYAFREMAPRLFQVLVQCSATFVKERDGVYMTYARPHIVLGHGNIVGGNGKEGEEDIHREIVAVNWAPPFEGPLSIPFDLVQSYYEAYAAFEVMLDSSINVEQRLAQQRQKRQIGNGEGRIIGNDLDLDANAKLQWNLSKYAHEHTWKYRMQQGEVLVFNNMRMLHGRHSFNMKDNNDADTSNFALKKDNKGNDIACRHLVGAYTNIDDTLNTYRDRLRQQGGRILSDCGYIPNVGNGTTSALP